jgi:Zn-dependent protease
MSLLVSLIMLPSLAIGLTVHEFAHAWTASLLGDNFARRQGRVSLNPFRHLSPLGTLAIFFLPFGWGKPVPINLYNFRHPKRDYLLSSLAGPAANFVLAGVCIALMHLTRHTYQHGLRASRYLDFAHHLLGLGAIINTILGVFNLIPIPPLDGSKIWPCLIRGLKPTFVGKRMWIFMAILIALLWTGSLRPFVDSVGSGLTELMPTSDCTLFVHLYEEASQAFWARDYARAESLVTQALALDPSSDECHGLRSSARSQVGDWQGALEDLNAAIGLCKFVPEYYECRAKVFTALGRPAQAQDDQRAAAFYRDPLGGSPAPLDAHADSMLTSRPAPDMPGE